MILMAVDKDMKKVEAELSGDIVDLIEEAGNVVRVLTYSILDEVPPEETKIAADAIKRVIAEGFRDGLKLKKEDVEVIEDEAAD